VHFALQRQEFRFVLQILDKNDRLNTVGAGCREVTNVRSFALGLARAKGRVVTQEAPNVIDLSAYRPRRGQHSPHAPATPSGFVQDVWVLAVPVLMPVVIAWLPIWSVTAVSAGASDE
jgi:hypothetical protein